MRYEQEVGVRDADAKLSSVAGVSAAAGGRANGGIARVGIGAGLVCGRSAWAWKVVGWWWWKVLLTRDGGGGVVVVRTEGLACVGDLWRRRPHASKQVG